MDSTNYAVWPWSSRIVASWIAGVFSYGGGLRLLSVEILLQYPWMRTEVSCLPITECSSCPLNLDLNLHWLNFGPAECLLPSLAIAVTFFIPAIWTSCHSWFQPSQPTKQTAHHCHYLLSAWQLLHAADWAAPSPFVLLFSLVVAP